MIFFPEFGVLCCGNQVLQNFPLNWLPDDCSSFQCAKNASGQIVIWQGKVISLLSAKYKIILNDKKLHLIPRPINTMRIKKNCSDYSKQAFT